MASEASRGNVRADGWQVGEFSTVGMSAEPRPGAESRYRIERIDVRNARFVGPGGSVGVVSATLKDVRVGVEAELRPGRLLQALTELSVGELTVDGATLEPPTLPPPTAGAGSTTWKLDALRSLDGVLHVDVTDAAWIFDADVTMPIAAGRVDFNRTTVEHVGPDSTMGLSRMGLHVDSPTGRTYLYLLTAAQVPGAHFEQRGGLLSPFGGDRGSIDLQPLLEALLSGLALGAPAAAMLPTLGRTALQGDFRLGDGAIAAGTDRIVLAERDRGRNRIELASPAGSRVVTIRIPELAASEVHVERFGLSVSTGPVTAALGIELSAADPAPKASVRVEQLAAQGIACKRSGSRTPLDATDEGTREAAPGGTKAEPDRT